MTEQYRELTPNDSEIQKCMDCDADITRDIFSLPKGEKTKGGGRLIEARVCEPCKIIYEILPE